MKKAFLTICSAFLAVLLFCSCGSDPARVSDSDSLINGIEVQTSESEVDYSYKSGSTTLPNTYNEYQNSALDFSFELLRNNYSENDNTTIAPANTFTQLCLLTNAAAKTTKKELTSALCKNINIESLNQSTQYFQTRLASFNCKSEDKNYSVNLKNFVWCNDTFDIKREFLKTDAKYYDIDFFRFLFSDSNALAKINNRTTDYTNIDGKPLKNLDSNAYMYSTGYLNISDNWLEDYAERNISTDTFKGTEKSSQVNFYASSEFLIKDENCKGFIKSFKNTPLKLCVILPDENITISDYLKTLNSETFANLLNSIDITKRCNAYLPEFSVSKSVDLTSALKNMGINALFTEEADLTNMTQSEDVHLNNFVQSIDFSISEKGISSEKIDEKTTENSTLDNETDVKVNRPFIFAVIDNESNIPLYLGIMENL